MKPTIFISSTYFDLKTERNEISKFCQRIGYDSMLSEKGDIAYAYDAPLDESCYNSVKIHADMFILIIGGRYGSPTSEFSGKVNLSKFHERYESITLKEYKCARDKNIPIFVFINRDVMVEYRTYNKQKEGGIVNENTPYAIVDSINVFILIEEVLTQTINNQYQPFDNYSDIENWLRDQWAGMYKDFLIAKREKNTSKEDEKLYNYKTFENSEEAFSDLFRKINTEAEMRSKISKEPFDLNLKGISFAMLHSKNFIFKNIPKVIEKFENLSFTIEIVIVDPKFFARLKIKDYGTDWLKRSRQIVTDLKQFNDENLAKFGSRLKVTYCHYSNIPHWHGWLFDNDFLFLGRTNWGRDSNNEPQLQIGQNRYRYFDKTNESGRERIQLFRAWFQFYTEMNDRIYSK